MRPGFRTHNLIEAAWACVAVLHQESFTRVWQGTVGILPPRLFFFTQLTASQAKWQITLKYQKYKVVPAISSFTLTTQSFLIFVSAYEFFS